NHHFGEQRQRWIIADSLAAIKVTPSPHLNAQEIRFSRSSHICKYSFGELRSIVWIKCSCTFDDRNSGSWIQESRFERHPRWSEKSKFIAASLEFMRTQV